MVPGVTGRLRQFPAVTPAKWKQRPSTVTEPKQSLKSIPIGGAGVLGRTAESAKISTQKWKQELYMDITTSVVRDVENTILRGVLLAGNAGQWFLKPVGIKHMTLLHGVQHHPIGKEREETVLPLVENAGSSGMMAEAKPSIDIVLAH